MLGFQVPIAFHELFLGREYVKMSMPKSQQRMAIAVVDADVLSVVVRKRVWGLKGT